MKKVLCLDYHFAPLAGSWVGGFKVIKFLPQYGWEPIVVSAAETVSYPKDYSLLPHIPKEIRVYRLHHREASLEWQYLRRKLKINFDFPDSCKGWYLPALRQAREILQQEKIDLIYSVSPSYTTALVALRLKKEFNVPWIAELIDAWSVNDYLLQFYSATLMRPLRSLLLYLMRRGERQILASADKVISIHRTLRRQLSEDYGIDEANIELVPDGYYESDFDQLIPRPLYPGKLTIIFLGNAYWGFKEIASNFVEIVGDLDREAEVVFIGVSARSFAGINPLNTTLVDHLPKEKALAFAAGGDFFLLVTLPSAKWHTPSKLYTYLRLGKPILALVPEDGDAAHTIRQAKAGFVLSYEPERLKQQMQTILDDWRQGAFEGFQPDWDYVAQFARSRLNERIVRIMDQVAA